MSSQRPAAMMAPEAAPRILVVEDEMLIAALIEEILTSLGHVVVGPVGRLDAALRLANDAVLDAAILDVTVRGGQTFPVAERLTSRGIPFLIASGYGTWALPEPFRHLPRLTKPFRRQELELRLQLLLTPRLGANRAAAP